jgi:hypothetical protein
VYREYPRSPTLKSKENITKSNKKGRKYNGYMSEQTKRKITRMLEAWISSIVYHNKRNYKVPLRQQRKPVFLTLTLSSDQVHDDYVIKRKILVPFISWLCVHKNVKYYFWRAEKQKNGNIHFHLIIDSYIDREEVQKVWNYFQDKLSYVANFALTHGHRNPPSTQIQKVPDGSDLVQYLIKYSTKDESSEFVEGRIWGCSDELREINVFEDNIDSKLEKDFEAMRESDSFTFVDKEHYTLIYFNKNEGKHSLPKEFRTRIREFYLKLYQSLYSSPVKKDFSDIVKENTESISILDVKEFWHQGYLFPDIFL